jgi:hypothetical protein
VAWDSVVLRRHDQRMAAGLAHAEHRHPGGVDTIGIAQQVDRGRNELHAFRIADVEASGPVGQILLETAFVERVDREACHTQAREAPRDIARVLHEAIPLVQDDDAGDPAAPAGQRQIARHAVAARDISTAKLRHGHLPGSHGRKLMASKRESTAIPRMTGALAISQATNCSW